MRHLYIDDELKQYIKAYDRLFDVIRVIDPVDRHMTYFKGKSTSVSSCSFCEDDNDCNYCIALKALEGKKTEVKIQHNADNKMYLMFAMPIKIDNEIVVIEMLKDITDNLIFETVEQGKGYQVRNIVEDVHTIIMKDPLTNIYNRRYIDQMLPMEINKSLEEGTPLAIAMTDIDSYKNINDTYGHHAGDVVIKAFSKILSDHIRSGVDWVARYGGDEFLICLHAGEEAARKILERMRHAIESADIQAHGLQIKLTSSFGLCTMEGSYKSPEEMIRCADYKLYKAKNDGKNRIA